MKDRKKTVNKSNCFELRASSFLNTHYNWLQDSANVAGLYSFCSSSFTSLGKFLFVDFLLSCWFWIKKKTNKKKTGDVAKTV